MQSPYKKITPSQIVKFVKKAQKIPPKNTLLYHFLITSANVHMQVSPSKKPQCVSGVPPRGVVARVFHVQNHLR